MSKKREAPPKPEELIQKLSERLDVVKTNLTGNDIFDVLVAYTVVMTMTKTIKREFKIAMSAVQLHTVAKFPSVLDTCWICGIPACTFFFSGEK